MEETLTPQQTAGPYRDRIIPAASLVSAPVAPYAKHYVFRLPDGDWVELPLLALPPDGLTAIVSLCITENSFDLEDRLSTAMAALARDLGAQVIVGMPTLGMVLAASVARKLGHPHYVPLSYSRKFWFDDALCVPVRSITSPGSPKSVYLDPRIVDRLQGKRVVIVDDVISTGTSMLAQLELVRRAGVEVSGIVTAMQETRVWIDPIRRAHCDPSLQVRTVLRSPLFRRTSQGWLPDPQTLPD